MKGSMLTLFIMDKRSVVIDGNYSDDSYDSESQELCVENSENLEKPLKVFNNSERQECNRKLKGLLSAKIVKSKTFTIDNILGIDSDERKRTQSPDSKCEENGKNSGYFGKPIPISPTALRQISKFHFCYLFFMQNYFGFKF